MSVMRLGAQTGHRLSVEDFSSEPGIRMVSLGSREDYTIVVVPATMFAERYCR
jgi:hypothetical protein